MAVDSDKYNIKVAERCFQILDLIITNNGSVGVSDVSNALDINVNMAFRLLASIQNAGYIDKDQKTGLYSLSMKCLRLSTTALQSHNLRLMTMPYLELLWHQFPKANVNMAIKEGDDILVIDRIDGQTLPRTYFTPGKKIPFHCTGLGKVLTCSLSEDEIRLMVDRCGLKAYTENTIVDFDKLVLELENVKREGVGRDRNEFIANDNCSAAPIFNHEGEIVAAISISALEQSMSVSDVEQTIPKLVDTANRISAQLGYSFL